MNAAAIQFRHGYEDAKSLIESVGIDLARLGNPPMMNKNYRSGFAKAIIDVVQAHE